METERLQCSIRLETFKSGEIVAEAEITAADVENLQRTIISQHGDRIDTKSGNMRGHCDSSDNERKFLQSLVVPKKRKDSAPRGNVRVAK
jgi:hypothetical protein